VKGNLGSTSAGASTPVSVFGGSFRKTDTTNFGAGVGAGISLRETSALGRLLTLLSANPSQGGGAALGLGAGVVITRDRTTQDLEDINGDGLPDLIQASVAGEPPDGKQIYVRLNLGGRFGALQVFPRVPWSASGDPNANQVDSLSISNDP